MSRMIIAAMVVTLMVAGWSCGAANCAAKRQGSAEKQEIKVDRVESILSQLNKVTSEMKSYEGRIEYLISQPLFESKTLRRGDLYYRRGEKGSALRINFKTLKQDDEDERKDAEHYIFDGVWLTHIDYQVRQVNRYQQAEPNEPIDAFELVGRNFPIIGFTKTDELREQFEITLAAVKGEEKEKFNKLNLKPLEKSRFAEDYISIDFWVDKEIGLPAKIVALSTEEDVYEIRFLDPKVNEQIGTRVFEVNIPAGFGTPEIIPLKRNGEK